MDGHTIRRERQAAGWTVAEACRELRHSSPEPLPGATSLIRMWRRWESGTGTSNRYSRLLDDLFVNAAGRASPQALRASSLTVWRRWLAFELRRIRDETGRSRDEVESRCGWERGTLAHIENAESSVTTEALHALLGVYEVAGDRWAAYEAAAANSRGLGWWQRFDEHDLPAWYSLSLGLEQNASRLRIFEPQAVTGLLQTAEYAAAIIRRHPTARAEEQVRRLVGLRMARQATITRDHDPLQLWVVLDETVLRRVVGDHAVMAAQLDHVAEMADRPNITVQVLPFAAGAHGSIFGRFEIFGFPWTDDTGVVYIEYGSGAVYLEEIREVEERSLAFQQLCAYALPPDDSSKLIRQIAKEYTRALHL